MVRLTKMAKAFAILSVMFGVSTITQLLWGLQSEDEPKTQARYSISFKPVKDLYTVPMLFWILLGIQITHSGMAIMLVYAVFTRKFKLISYWITAMEVYLMIVFSVMPLILKYHRFFTTPLNMLSLCFSFPFYICSVVVMMLFYADYLD